MLVRVKWTRDSNIAYLNSKLIANGSTNSIIFLRDTNAYALRRIAQNDSKNFKSHIHEPKSVGVTNNKNVKSLLGQKKKGKNVTTGDRSLLKREEP